MITLITGTPGAGKTALAVAMLIEEQGSRPLFVSGIPELKLDHQLTPPVEDWTQDVPTPEDPSFKKPVFVFPPNSIIVIDEAQNIYRPRAASSKVPPYVAAFETHRHTGVDFWLITQHPSLLDANIRKLIGRHIHIRSTPLGRRLYEWPECGDPESKTSRDISASRSYRLPKKVFGLYKSSTLHINTKYRMPFAFYIIIAAILVGSFLAYTMYGRYKQISNPSNFNSPAPSNSISPPSSSPSQSRMTASEYIQAHNPRIPNLVHTAPVFDEMTKPSRVPVPAGCIASATRCRCYTQQATPYVIDDAMCRHIVSGGLFVPFDPDPATSQSHQDRGRGGGASFASIPAAPAVPHSEPVALVTTPVH